MVCNRIHGRTQHRILAFLMSLHVVERPVWLVRAGPIDCDDPDLPAPLPAPTTDAPPAPGHTTAPPSPQVHPPDERP